MRRIAVVEQMQAQMQDYLHSNPPDYRFQVDSLLELLYHAFTEYNIMESPEFKMKLEPLEQKLRSLAKTAQAAQGQPQTVQTEAMSEKSADEVADEYMNYA